MTTLPEQLLLLLLLLPCLQLEQQPLLLPVNMCRCTAAACF
jgi:hypothetical protein